MLLGFVLGPTMEDDRRRALLMSRSDWGTFATRPLSAGLLACVALMIAIVVLPAITKKREQIFRKD